jgi:hypothetical protein
VVVVVVVEKEAEAEGEVLCGVEKGSKGVLAAVVVASGSTGVELESALLSLSEGDVCVGCEEREGEREREATPVCEFVNRQKKNTHTHTHTPTHTQKRVHKADTITTTVDKETNIPSQQSLARNQNHHRRWMWKRLCWRGQHVCSQDWRTEVGCCFENAVELDAPSGSAPHLLRST